MSLHHIIQSQFRTSHNRKSADYYFFNIVVLLKDKKNYREYINENNSNESEPSVVIKLYMKTSCQRKKPIKK